MTELPSLARASAWLPPLPALPLESLEADRLLGSLTAGEDYELCLRSRWADSKTFAYESKARQAMRAFVMGRISDIRDFDENTQTLTLRNLARATDKARTYFYNDVRTLKDTIRSESSRADATREWCYEDPGNDAESVVYVECGPLAQIVNGPLAVGYNVLVDVSLHRRDLYFDKVLTRAYFLLVQEIEVVAIEQFEIAGLTEGKETNDETMAMDGQAAEAK